MSFDTGFQTALKTSAPVKTVPTDGAISLIEEKERILIVDDSIIIRKVFANYLSDRYLCVEAGSYDEAIEQLNKSDFVLALVDQIMPGLSGTELLRKIVEKYTDTAVIMVSGINQPQRALDAIRLGAFDYLIKPCELGVLELTVERALERRSLMLNARRYKLDLEAQNLELVRGKEALQRLQAQIIHNEKMVSLGQLAAGIAHELNNPIGFVYGNLDILTQYIHELVKLLDFYDKTDLPVACKSEADLLKNNINYNSLRQDLNSIIDDCQTGVERIRDIVQNLRTFSRLDEAEFKKTDIHEGINSSIRLLSRYFSGGNISLVRNYGELPLIDAYSGQLNQVWMNLLVNAAQAANATNKSQNEVRITTRVVGENVNISVSDTGGGIAPEHLSRIFDPFFTTKPVGEGTGLGLSITFGIVERHHGKITVKTDFNEGSTFTVSLPANIVSTPSAPASDDADENILDL